MKKRLLNTFFILCFFFFVKNIEAQSYTIDQGGTISTCAGNFHDSDSLGNYLDNETYIMTFCSDGGGNSLNIGFGTLFDIDPSDTLFVYDGPTTASPLLGAYNNNNILTGIATTTDGSGCLTFEFVSDGAVNGQGWLAIINCLTICQPINAVITTIPGQISYGPDSNYTNICAGDNVQFSATGTYPDNGTNPFNYTQSDATSTFDWEYGNGATSTGINGNSTYLNEQGYLVLLTITDVNGCVELVRHKVRTGITPIFANVLANPDTVCFGDTTSLFGGFTQTVGQNSTVTVDTGYVSAGGIVSGQTYLPDGNGNSYTTTVNIGGFSGQTIANGSDITEVCLNMEHSYIGDLDITLTCPNGTTIILSDTYNGVSPGNTFLGDADDSPSPSPPGIGMDYCFDLTAAWGTMTVENNNNNWIPSTITPGNNILTPGSFQPDQSFNNLVGCPIDGNWTITVTDNIGSDDGYIFEWGIALNPAITPNIEAYTVNMLTGIWLTNPDIINDYDTLAIAYPSLTGDNPFTFQVTDEFGCTFDTIITVHSLPEIVVTTLDTTLNCGDQINIPLEIQGSTKICTENASFNGQDNDPATVAAINNFSCVPPSGVVSGITLDATIGTFCGATSWYTYDIIINGVTQFTQQCDQTGLDLTPFLPITSVSIDANDEDGVGDNVTLDLTLNITYSDYPYSYAWTPAITLDDPTIRNPLASPIISTDYIVIVIDTNFNCTGTDTASIIIPCCLMPTVDSVDVTCNGGTDGKINVSITGINPPYTIEFYDNTGLILLQSNTVPAADSLLNLPAGTYIIKITDALPCISYDTITINEPTPVILSNLSSDTTICINGTANLQASVSGGTGTDSLIWDNGLIGNGPHSVNPLDSTIYIVYGRDSLGCISPNDTIIVTLFDSIIVNPIPSDTVCSSSPGDTTTLTANATGGHGNGFTYEWYDGSNNLIGNTQAVSITPVTSPETFTVYVGDDCTTPRDTMTVDIYWHPSFQPLFDTTIAGDYCLPVNVSFINTTDPLMVQSVTWDFGDGSPLSTSNPNAAHSYANSGTYNLTLTVTSPDGCVEDTTSIGLVTAYSFPIAEFSFSPATPNTNNTEITFDNLSSGNDTNFWSFTSGVPSTSMNIDPVVVFPNDSAGVYPVELIVANAAGCRDTTKWRFVEIDGVYLFYVPNSFTPNDDGTNDIFRAYGDAIDLSNFTMQIFDRWGELIYEINDIENGWDGSYNGKPVLTGTYIWRITSKEKYTPIIHKISGHVTLIK